MLVKFILIISIIYCNTLYSQEDSRNSCSYQGIYNALTIPRISYTYNSLHYLKLGLKYPIKKFDTKNVSNLFLGVNTYSTFVDNRFLLIPEVDTFYAFTFQFPPTKNWISMGLGGGLSYYYLKPKALWNIYFFAIELGYNIPINTNKYTNFEGFSFSIGYDFF